MYRYLIAVCSFFSTKSSKHSIQRNKQEMSWLVKTLITSKKVKRISAIGNLRRIRREYLIASHLNVDALNDKSFGVCLLSFVPVFISFDILDPNH